MSEALPVPSGSEPFSYPLEHPDPSSKLPPARAPLSDDQRKKLEDLTSHFNREGAEWPTTVKALKNQWRIQSGGSTRSFGSFFRAAPVEEEEPVLKQLTDKEKCYWSTEAFQRCLRATKWVYQDAVKRAEETLVWRREFCDGVDEMTPELVSHEGETGKELVAGYDINFRPVLYMHPYRQNTQESMSQINFVVWCLERTIDLCPPTDPATETLCLCIDFGANRSGDKTPPTSLRQAKRVLDILQTYYCERLGRAVCVNIPTFFWAFYKLVGPFVDPVTKDKIRFISGEANATELVPASQLQKIFGGDVNFEYDHSTYFPALSKLCAERKAANFARWQKYGNGKCGLSESVIRGAVTPEELAAKLTSGAEAPESTSTSATSTVINTPENGAAIVSATEESKVGMGLESVSAGGSVVSTKEVEKAVESLSLGETPAASEEVKASA
ncbi:CRAL/TRIO domain-containing protein [Meredithblackwellia eburnea MCA 4105]